MYNNSDLFLAGGMIVVTLIAFAIGILIAILYLLNLQKTLEEVQVQNRDVPPTNVWLMLIPLFNIVYPFILYPRISHSISREYAERGLPAEGDFGRSIGVAMPILSLCGIIPVLGSLAALANLVLFIIYWVKMAKYKQVLRSTPIGLNNARISNSTELLD